MNEFARASRWRVNWMTVGFLAATLALTGCVTQQQVQRIVADSNAQLLASQFPEPQLLPKPGEPAGDDVSRRIDEFIAAHPDQKTLNGSLRVRQAIIYLDRKQYNLAEAAFNAAKAYQPLPGARDDALVNVRESLVWWYENSGGGSFDEVQMGHATGARKAFNEEARKRASSPDIRDFLAETGAWVGLKHFDSVTTSGEQKLLMEQTINDYAFVLGAEDLKWLCNPGPMTDQVDMQTVRRRVRAETVLDQASMLARDMKPESRPIFRDPVVQEIVAPGSQTPTCQRRPTK